MLLWSSEDATTYARRGSGLRHSRQFYTSAMHPDECCDRMRAGCELVQGGTLNLERRYGPRPTELRAGAGKAVTTSGDPPCERAAYEHLFFCSVMQSCKSLHDLRIRPKNHLSYRHVSFGVGVAAFIGLWLAIRQPSSSPPAINLVSSFLALRCFAVSVRDRDILSHYQPFRIP